MVSPVGTIHFNRCLVLNEWTIWQFFWFKIKKIISFSAYFWIKLNWIDWLFIRIKSMWSDAGSWRFSSSRFVLGMIDPKLNDFRFNYFFRISYSSDFSLFIFFSFRMNLSPENINILDSWTRFWVHFIFRQKNF